jgi:hypothetical protein
MSAQRRAAGALDGRTPCSYWLRRRAAGGIALREPSGCHEHLDCNSHGANTP